MRMFKLITAGLVVAIVAIFIYQNIPTFKGPQGFKLDLYIHEPIEWQHQLYTLLLFATLLGFLAGVVLILKPYLNTRRLLAQVRQEKQQEKPPEAAGTPREETGETPIVESPTEKHE